MGNTSYCTKCRRKRRRRERRKFLQIYRLLKFKPLILKNLFRLFGSRIRKRSYRQFIASQNAEFDLCVVFRLKINILDWNIRKYLYLVFAEGKVKFHLTTRERLSFKRVFLKMNRNVMKTLFQSLKAPVCILTSKFIH
jgi:hypothetical protein